MGSADGVAWPYLIDEAEDSLSPGLIEQLGREILARAASHGRLVAFLGAGMSMAYGRQSWASLVYAAITEVCKLRGQIELNKGACNPALEAVFRTLQADLQLKPDDAPAAWLQRIKADGGSWPLILQLCARALELGAALELEEPVLTVNELIRRDLGEDLAHDRTFREAYAEFIGSGGKDALLSALKKVFDEPTLPTLKRPLPPRRHFLELLLEAKSSNWQNLSPDERLPTVRAHQLHSNGDASALSLLHHEFAIHRFATTNYDRVIERSLEVAGLVPLRPLDPKDARPGGQATSPTRQTYAVVDLTPGSTGAALAFAVDGRRRHAQVLHLHGKLDDPDQLIVSERDYQQRYLRRSARRDLLDISVRTLFGASPILFVGTSVSEDDVLRPLREFMSAAPRRGDRVAVALLPAKAPSAQLALDKIRCLVRYGIYVIHYGYEQAGHFKDDRQPLEPWLAGFTEHVKALRERLRPPRDGGSNAPAKSLDRVRAPQTMEGIVPAECGAQALDIGVELRLLEAIADLVDPPLISDSTAKQTETAATTAIEKETAAFIDALLEEITTSITSAFVCARLMAERRFRHHWAEQLVAPLATYRTERGIRRLALGAHEVELMHFGPLRKVTDAWRSDQGLDPRWQEFFDQLKLRTSFGEQWRGRRFVTMSMPRGTGKGSMFDALVAPNSEALEGLLEALGQGNPKPRWRVGLVGLGFLFDVGAMAKAVKTMLSFDATTEPARPDCPPAPEDIVEGLRAAMTALARRPTTEPPTRVLLVISNVGAMFDADGETKNGQLLQLLRIVEHRDFRKCKLDILMLCDEGHLPRRFRSAVGRHQAALDGFLQSRIASTHTYRLDEPDDQPRDGLPGWLQGGAASFQHPNASRLREAGVLLEDPMAPWSIVHTPSNPLPEDVISAFEHLGAFWARTPRPEQLAGALNRLHQSVGSHRMALTLILALAEDRLDSEAGAHGLDAMVEFIESVACAMALHLHESTPDKAIQFVLDEWGSLHQRRPGMVSCQTVKRALRRVGVVRPDEGLSAEQGGRFWELCVEVLWHLAVLSHPADIGVLKRCPEILSKVKALVSSTAGEVMQGADQWIRLAAEACVERCLAFRVAARGALPGEPPEGARPDRYVLHRLVQRHFLRLMGGRNVESMEWDQFAPSTYASQPDELPTLSDEGHTKIRGLIRALIDYGQWPPKTTDAPGDQDALRAAYFAVRSSYSVGVLSHIAMRESPDHPAPQHGHMEEYRRIVRWITHRACKEPVQTGEPKAAFQQGELVWLYAECGVISLTQGKLEDAETALQLALTAARQIESHSTGSLHARLLLHMALVHLERGRPGSARQLLEPISRRTEDHAVPPLLATFYLGLIDHLGGEYHAALERYNAALLGLRRLRRTRATAFVLKCKAEALFCRHLDRRTEAIELAHEAVSVAQRGGHEDVRFLATLALIRMRVADRPGFGLADAYQQLELASSYAAAMGMPRISAQVHEVRAHVLMSQGETRLSAQEAAEAAQIAALYDMKLIKTKSLLTLARVYRMRGEFVQAQQLIRQGMEIAHACEYGACLRSFQSLDSSLSIPGFGA